jgi:hypothetical protein
MHFEYPPWSDELRRLYWHLRNARPWDTAQRRRFYRLIAAEKKRLHAEGVPQIELHLVTRLLCNPRNNNYRMRYANYVKQLTIWHMLDA